MKYIYEFFVCFHVIGEQTSNKIEDIIECYSNKIEDEFSNDILNKLRKSMVDRLPTKENFCNSIKRICFSNHWKAYSGKKKSENVHAICEVIERELGFDGDFNDCNVEHCLPDATSKDHSIIGNLFLLETSLNDLCRDKALSDKVAYYKQSKYKLPHLIVSAFENNDDFNIADRTQWFAETLYDYIYKIAE